MRKIYTFWKRVVIFSAVLCVILHCINKILTPKYLYEDTWPTTATYTEFYKLEDNSVDVFFLGSSNAAAGFIPQELYNNYGITSYNLGCEQQSMLVSYYWLKEALRTQSPQVIILDCLMLFPFGDMGVLNSSEECTRKALDYMRLGRTKREAVNAICGLDETLSDESFYFTNIRYHTRWKELSVKDFSIGKIAESGQLKGYAPLFGKGNNETWCPFEDKGEMEGCHEMNPVMREYFCKIAELCRQQGITLIMVKTPTTDEHIGKYNGLKLIAQEQGLVFLDFNEEKMYEQLEFVYSLDMNDDAHCNISGAAKLTNFMGEYLVEKKLVEEIGKYDPQWEKTKEYYGSISVN